MQKQIKLNRIRSSYHLLKICFKSIVFLVSSHLHIVLLFHNVDLMDYPWLIDQMVFGSIVMEFKDNIECNKTIPSFLIYKCSWLQVKRHIFPLWHFRRIKTKTKKFCCCYVWVEDVEANLKECTRKSNSCTDEFFFNSIAHSYYLKRSKV